jgi:hypothetical protein
MAMTRCRGHLGFARQNREGSEGGHVFLRRFFGGQLKQKLAQGRKGARPQRISFAQGHFLAHLRVVGIPCF